MAHARLIVVLTLVACGGHASAPVTHPQDNAAAEQRKLPRFHSSRFSVSLPLPDGKTWRIDDHSASVLRATQATTQSKVELATWHEDDLMNRQRCEERARIKGFGERAGDEVDSEVASVPSGWDTLVWVSGEKLGNDVVGHVYAFASNIRKCLYFHYETRSADAAAIADRLAFARLRILGDLRLDTFDIPREKFPQKTDDRGNAPRTP